LAAGHGGQVLLSADAHAALSATRAGWQAKALGEFRFKGIGSPQNVFQLLLDGLPADFPPLRIDRLPPSVAPGAFGRSVRGYELREQVGAGDFGVVYRDLKPANVLLDEEGHAYLSDFGIAARLADRDNPARPVTSSPAYVPPEELAGQHTPRSDIYGLGLLTFELLTGQRPPMDGSL